MKDAEEVKEHRFFRGIDWEAVRRRELRPPVVAKGDIPVGGVPAEHIFGDLCQSEMNRVLGWTFVEESVS